MRRGLPTELLEPGPGRHRLRRRFGGRSPRPRCRCRRPGAHADGRRTATPNRSASDDGARRSGPGSILGLSCATERAASSTAGSTTQVTGAVARPLRFSSRSSRPSGASDRCHRAESEQPAGGPAADRFLTGTTSASRVGAVGAAAAAAA